MANEIEQFAQDWKTGMGPWLGETIVAVIEGDTAGKKAYIEGFTELVGMDNIPFSVEATVIGVDQPIQMAVSVPAVALAALTACSVEEAEIKSSVDISQHEENNTNVNASNVTEGSVSAGGGFLGMAPKVNVKSTVKAGVTNERKRSTDSRATADVRVMVRQQPPTEIMSRLMDKLGDVMSRVMDVNMELISRQSQQQLDAISEMDKLPSADAEAATT